MRLEQQITFLKELDKLKHVIRQTILLDKSRKENTAEHSWHVAMAVITLAEYADEPIDTMRVLKMLLVHDIVEIDAGDTFAFDEVGYEDKAEREQQAADRIFGLLPDEQEQEFMALWKEFEAHESNDALFANAIDRILPFLHNTWADGGGSWEEHHPTYEQVYNRNKQGVGRISQKLWVYVQQLLDKALEQGMIEKADEPRKI